MKPYSICCVLLFMFTSVSGQDQKNPVAVFEPLFDRTWQAEGTWGDGSIFKQEISFSAALNKALVVVSSKGFTDQERTAYGLRNYGIRWYDKATSQWRFWEFDVFGGLTEGRIVAKDKNIAYQYNYGGSELTDLWEYVNDSTYNFTVGSYKNDKWEQRYLQSQFTAVSSGFTVAHFGKRLAGNWSSKAWDGRLDEYWEFSPDGQLNQNAKYFENGKIQYQANSKIEKVSDDFIIFSVIKNSDPKIFKASSVSKDQIIFENSEYQYPNKVIYNFNDDGTYNRTISGIQDGKPSSYTFKFKKAE